MSISHDFRLTSDSGSKLLYWKDEFVAKLSSRHASAFLAVLAANAIMRDEIDGFTTHVGADTFDDAVAVTFRGKAQDMDVIEQQHNTIKRLGEELENVKKDFQTWLTKKTA